jgi:hypothetical protein
MSNDVNVPDNETVSHFAYHESSYYTGGKNQLRFTAFMSPKVPGEVSVYRIDNLSEFEIWNIGDDLRSDKKSKARGDMQVTDITAIKNEQGKNLQVVEDTVSHRLHANIINLPTIDKAKQRVVAVQLAEKTILKIKP